MLPWTYYVPTALYYLDKVRYAKYISTDREKTTSYINWHHRKWNIQREYIKELEHNGPILRSIYVSRVAEDGSRAVDYLNWLSWVWELYCKNLKRDEFQDEGFIRFCQSDLIWDTELVETWIFK